MPLKLVLGPANSAKAGEVLGAYAQASQRGALQRLEADSGDRPADYAIAL